MSAVASSARRRRSIVQLIMLLAALAILALAGTALAINLAAGHPLPWQFRMRAVSPHVAIAFGTLGLGALQLALKKGDRRHRLLGYAWCGLMSALAVSGIAVQLDPGGRITPIHMASSGSSIITLILLPVVIWAGRTGRRRLHRNTVVGLFCLMLMAGALTFIPHRTMGLLMRGATESVSAAAAGASAWPARPTTRGEGRHVQRLARFESRRIVAH